MSVPLIEVCGVTKHFVKRLDLAGQVLRHRVRPQRRNSACRQHYRAAKHHQQYTREDARFNASRWSAFIPVSSLKNAPGNAHNASNGKWSAARLRRLP